MFIISYTKNGKDFFLTRNKSQIMFSNIKIDLEIFENIDTAKKSIIQLRKNQQYKNCNFYISNFNINDYKQQKNVINLNIDEAVRTALNNLLSKELEYKIEKKNKNLIITTNNRSKEWNNLYEIKFEFGPLVIILKLKHWQELKNISLEKYKKSFKLAIYSYFMELSKR